MEQLTEKEIQAVKDQKKLGAMESGELQYQQLGFEDDEYVDLPLPMSGEGIIDKSTGEPLITFDLKEFKSGVKEASKLAGYYTALRMAGASEQFIFNIIANNNDVDVANKQIDAQIKINKDIIANEEKQTL